MDSIKLVVIIAVAFTSIVTALNWSKLEPLQRILYPLQGFLECHILYFAYFSHSVLRDHFFQDFEIRFVKFGYLD